MTMRYAWFSYFKNEWEHPIALWQADLYIQQCCTYHAWIYDDICIHTHKYTDIHCIALHRIALHCIALHYTHTHIYVLCVRVLRKHARNRHLNLWHCKDGIGSYRVHVTFLEAQVDGEWLAGIAFAAQNHTDTADMRRQCDLQV